MIKLINNEFVKIKKTKIFIIYFMFIIVLLILKKYSNKNILELSYNLIQFIGVCCSILFSGCICGEIENGNMRYYLTKPYNRKKIYVSKLLSIIIYIFLNILIIIFTTLLINKSIDFEYIEKYFINCIPIFFVGSFTLFLSTKYKNSVLVASISIITLSFSLILSQLLFGFDFKIIEYTILPYLDFTIFNNDEILLGLNNDFGISLNINRAVIINILSTFLVFIIGLIKFNKKDIKS